MSELWPIPTVDYARQKQHTRLPGISGTPAPIPVGLLELLIPRLQALLSDAYKPFLGGFGPGYRHDWLTDWTDPLEPDTVYLEAGDAEGVPGLVPATHIRALALAAPAPVLPIGVRPDLLWVNSFSPPRRSEFLCSWAWVSGSGEGGYHYSLRRDHVLVCGYPIGNTLEEHVDRYRGCSAERYVPILEAREQLNLLRTVALERTDQAA